MLFSCRPLDSGGGGQNYKNSAASVNAAQTVSPPMARTSTNNGGGGGGIPAPPSQPPAGVTPSGGGCYPSAVAYSPHPPPPAAGGDARYIPQTMIGTYRQDHYQRSNMVGVSFYSPIVFFVFNFVIFLCSKNFGFFFVLRILSIEINLFLNLKYMLL